jgi:hydrogenase maturation protease
MPGSPQATVRLGGFLQEVSLDADACGPPARCQPSETLVLGLGNPILGDDGAGWRGAQRLRDLLAAPRAPLDGTVELDCAALGGIGLMERILGYRRVVLIDAMQTGRGRVGCVRVCPLEALADPTRGHSGSVHDASLLVALGLARAVGAVVPSRIDVVGIEVAAELRFSEELSRPVARAIDRAAVAVLALLEKESA